MYGFATVANNAGFKESTLGSSFNMNWNLLLCHKGDDIKLESEIDSWISAIVFLVITLIFLVKYYVDVCKHVFRVLFSFLEFPLPMGIAFIGEIGLGGEIRTVCILRLLSFFFFFSVCVWNFWTSHPDNMAFSN